MKSTYKNLIKYTAFALVVSILFLSIQGLVMGNSLLMFGESKNTNDSQGDGVSTSGDIQKVTLSMDGYTYILTPSVLQKNVPVEMEVDLSTVTGCMRDIVIKDFGVRQYVSEGKDIIRFTPDKAGTIKIACSMNMGRGTFTVVDYGAANAAGESALVSNDADASFALAGDRNEANIAPTCGMGAAGKEEAAVAAVADAKSKCDVKYGMRSCG